MPLVIDAFVESSIDYGSTWQRISDPEPDFRWFDGPWSIPHAIEIGRRCWSAYLRVTTVTTGTTFDVGARVRVVDTAGELVEQWPKR